MPTSSDTGATVIAADWVLQSKGDELKLLRDHEVVVRGDRIEETRAQRGSNDRRVDARGQVLLPGLISGHTHSAAGTSGRGLLEGGGQTSGLLRAGRVDPRGLRAMEVMEDLDDEELDSLTAANVATLIKGGCTTHVEMSLSQRDAESYLRIAERLGARSYLAAMVPQISRVMSIWARPDTAALTSSVPETLREIERASQFARKVDGAQEGRIRPMLAITVTAAHTRATLLAIRTASEELDCPIHLHVQSGASDPDPVVEASGLREVPLLAELGILDRPVFAAHLAGVDLDIDLPHLLRPTVTFVHCPSAGGVAQGPGGQPYPEALAAGLRTALGLDAHSGDMLENIKLAVIQGRARELLLRAHSNVPLRRPSIWDAIRSATVSSADGLGRHDLGRIEPGAKADLITVDISDLFTGGGAPAPAPLNNLLYANGLCVRNVMTDGVWQKRDGRLLLADEVKLGAKRGIILERLGHQLNSEGYFTPELESAR